MAKAKKEQTPDEAMAKNEKHNDGTVSGLKKTIIGTVGTLVTAGGAFLMTYVNTPKNNDKPVQPQSININMPAPAPAAETKTIIIKEKSGETGATGATTPVKKKDGDEFKKKEPLW